MTIDELKSLQETLGLKDVHLVFVGSTSFTIAHTDEERASPVPLEECSLHQWLLWSDGPPLEPGIYMATKRVHDAVSESFRSGASGYTFERIRIRP